MKKIILLLLVFSLGFNSFTLGAVDPLNGGDEISTEVVPVLDEEVLKMLRALGSSLDTLLIINSREFQKLNTRIMQMLKGQIDEKLSDVFNDLANNKSYLETIIELRRFINLSRVLDPNRPIFNDLQSVNDYILVDAAKLGALTALSELPKNFPCFSQSVKPRILNETMAMASAYGLEYTAAEIINSIPDCSELRVLPTTYTFKETFLTRIIKPFGFLAELHQQEPATFQMPTMVVESKFNNVLESIEFKETTESIKNLLDSRILQEQINMKSMLTPVVPIKRSKVFFDDHGCMFRKPIILESMESVQQSIFSLKSSDKTSPSTLESRSIFTNLTDPSLFFIGFNVFDSNLNISQNVLNVEEAKLTIERYCENFRRAELKEQREPLENIFLAYLECLDNFQNELSLKINLEKNKIENIKPKIQNAYHTASRLLSEAKRLHASTTDMGASTACSCSLQNLGAIMSLLERHMSNYKTFERRLDELKMELDESQRTLTQIDSDIKNLITEIRYRDLSVINILRKIASTTIGLNITNPRSVKFPLIPMLLQRLKEIEFEGEEKVLEFLREIENILILEAEILVKLNNFSSTLAEDELSLAHMALNFNSYDDLEKNIYPAFENYLQNGACKAFQKQSLVLAQTKPKKFLVKETNQPKKSYNFISRVFENLFQAKSVEINFKR